MVKSLFGITAFGIFAARKHHHSPAKETPIQRICAGSEKAKGERAQREGQKNISFGRHGVCTEIGKREAGNDRAHRGKQSECQHACDKHETPDHPVETGSQKAASDTVVQTFGNGNSEEEQSKTGSPLREHGKQSLHVLQTILQVAQQIHSMGVCPSTSLEGRQR